MRKADELSITTQPAAAATGPHFRETSLPAENKAISAWEKSNLSSALTFRGLSPKNASLPTERVEARATTSSAGKVRSCRIFSISRPTFPVAPTTATLTPMSLIPCPKKGAHQYRLTVVVFKRLILHPQKPFGRRFG